MQDRPRGWSTAWLRLVPALALLMFSPPLAAAPQRPGWGLRPAADAPSVESPTPETVADSQVGPPVVRSVHLAQTGDLTRLVFDLSGPVEASAFVLSDPRRVIIDLPEVSFQIDPNAGRSAADAKPIGRSRGAKPVLKPIAGVIASFRFGLFAPGKSGVVVDLAEPARIVRVDAGATTGQPGARLVLDLARTDAAAFTRAALEGEKRAAARQTADVSAAKPPVTDNALPVVVIDPGHGGIDTGAHGASDTLEKNIVFEFARSLAARLTEQGKFRVLMTRTEDIFVPLGERVQIARNAGAALFVSIHADTLSDAASVSGATVYTVSDKASDAEAARVAEKENMADIVGGLDGKEDAGDVSDILFDLTRRETRAYSHVFARTLIGYFKETARLNKNPQRAAGFRVLKAPDVPSVLLELGYLSSEHDLAQLRSPEWRDTASRAVARSIDTFFASRAPGAPERASVAEPEVQDLAAAVAPALH